MGFKPIVSSCFGQEMKKKLFNYPQFGRLTMSSNERKLEMNTCLKCIKFELEIIASSIKSISLKRKVCIMNLFANVFDICTEC